MNTLRKNADAGFTVIELLVVLVIIGLLSGIAYVGLSSARSNSIQDSCKAAFQATYLGISSYQTDHGGNMPGSIVALEPNYLSASTVETYSKNFTLQLGSFSAWKYKIDAGVATVYFKSDYKPQIVSGEKIIVAGIDSNTIDGTWTVLAPATLDPTIGAWAVSFNLTSYSGTVNLGLAPVGGYINAISKTGDPFDVYIFDRTGQNRVGTTTAPAACSSL